MSRPKKEDQLAAEKLKLERKARISHLHYRDRRSQEEIGLELGVTRQYVGQLLSEVRAEDRDSYILPRQEARQDELRTLQERERQLSEILEQSRQPVEQVVDYGRPGKDGIVKVERSVRTRTYKPQDVRAAMGLVKISDQRVKLLGLIEAPKLEEPPVPQLTPYEALPEAERVRIFMETLVEISKDGEARLQERERAAQAEVGRVIDAPTHSVSALPPASEDQR